MRIRENTCDSTRSRPTDDRRPAATTVSGAAGMTANRARNCRQMSDPRHSQPPTPPNGATAERGRTCRVESLGKNRRFSAERDNDAPPARSIRRHLSFRYDRRPRWGTRKTRERFCCCPSGSTRNCRTAARADHLRYTARTTRRQLAQRRTTGTASYNWQNLVQPEQPAQRAYLVSSHLISATDHVVSL